MSNITLVRSGILMPNRIIITKNAGFFHHFLQIILRITKNTTVATKIMQAASEKILFTRTLP